jgi:hypothetical protein
MRAAQLAPDSRFRTLCHHSHSSRPKNDTVSPYFHYILLAMIIKEYRVVMPLSVEEYQVAQLYMVAKLSAQQTGIFLSFDNVLLFS